MVLGLHSPKQHLVRVSSPSNHSTCLAALAHAYPAAGCDRAALHIEGVTNPGSGWVPSGSNPFTFNCDAQGWQHTSVTATCTTSGWSNLASCVRGKPQRLRCLSEARRPHFVLAYLQSGHVTKVQKWKIEKCKNGCGQFGRLYRRSGIAARVSELRTPLGHLHLDTWLLHVICVHSCAPHVHTVTAEWLQANTYII